MSLAIERSRDQGDFRHVEADSTDLRPPRRMTASVCPHRCATLLPSGARGGAGRSVAHLDVTTVDRERGTVGRMVGAERRGRSELLAQMILRLSCSHRPTAQIASDGQV